MLKYFTERNEMHGNRSIAVNPINVSTVFEGKEFTTILLVSGRSIEITDSYLDTVARLNEV
jgi:hypothetical protein